MMAAIIVVMVLIIAVVVAIIVVIVSIIVVMTTMWNVYRSHFSVFFARAITIVVVNFG